MSFLHDHCPILPSSRWIAVAVSFRWLHPSPRRMALSVYRYDILHRHCSQSLSVTCWAQHLQNWAVTLKIFHVLISGAYKYTSCFVMFCSFLRCLAHQIWWDVHVLARHYARLGYSRCQRSWGSKVLRTRPRAHENIRRGADVMLHADTNRALEIGLLKRKLVFQPSIFRRKLFVLGSVPSHGFVALTWFDIWFGPWQVVVLVLVVAPGDPVVAATWRWIQQWWWTFRSWTM